MRIFLYGIFFLLFAASAQAVEISATDEIIVRSVNAVVFAMTANLKLTPDQVAAVRPIVTDYTVKVSKLQQSLREGAIDGKTMFDKRAELTDEEDKALGPILSPSQMKMFIMMQKNQSI
jgi:hypothetical protein